MTPSVWPNPGTPLPTALLGPGDYLHAIRRHWMLIVCCAITGLAAAALYVRFFPDTYASQAIVRFNPPQLPDRYVTANDSMQAEQRLFALTQMLTSSVTARKQIESQGLYPEMRRFRTVEDLVPRFQRNLTVRRVNLAGVDPKRALPSLHLSFSYSSPEKARRVLMNLVESIHEANRSYRGDQSNATTEFLRMQAEQTQERILELETQISGLGMFDRMAGDHQWALKIQQLYSVENRLGHVQSSLRNMQRDRADRLNELSDHEARLKRVQAMVNPRTELPSYELQWMRRKQDDLRAVYQQLRDRYQDDYPEVAAAKLRLDEASANVKRQEDQELDAARQRARRELGVKVDALRADIAAYDQAIAEQQAEETRLARQAASIRSTTNSAPEDDMEYLRLTREYEVLKEFHRALVKKQQEANVGSEMERLGRGEAIELVEPPTLPTEASQPVGPLKLVLGFLGGLFLGAGVACFGTIQNPQIRFARQFELWPGLPLLADIPRALPAPAAAVPDGFRVRIRWKRGSLWSIFLLTAVLSNSGCSLWKASTQALLARARQAEQAGDLRRAAVVYRQALARDARLGEAHAALARIELDIGEVDKGYSHLLRAVELRPGDMGLLLRLAEITYLIYTADGGRSEQLLLELESAADQLCTRDPRRPEGPIYRALALQERHRAPQAEQVLRDAIMKIGQEPSLLTQLASVIYQAGRRDESSDLLEPLVASGAPYAPAYDLLYLQRMQARDQKAGDVLRRKWEAIGDLDSALQLAAHMHATGDSPGVEGHLSTLPSRLTRTDTIVRIGDFWLHRGDKARARALYQQALTAPSSRSLAASRLAELAQSSGSTAEARQILERELKAAPSDDLLRAHQAALRLETARGEQQTEARLQLEMILQRMPRSSFVRYHLGRAYLRIGDLVRARVQFDRCVRLDPNYAPGWLALAEADLRAGYTVIALERVDRLLAHAPKMPAALLMKARLQAARGQLGDAARTMDSLDRAGISGPHVALERANILLLGSNVEEAIRVLKAASESAPGNEQIIALLARAEAAAGRIPAALERLARARAAAPQSEVILPAWAELSARGGKPVDAATAYRQLVSIAPANVNYRIGLADALALTGSATEALAEYDKAQKQSPTELRCWLHAGALLSSTGRFAEARDAYRRALTISPGHPLVLNNLAYTLARLGEQIDYALELAQQAEKVIPASAEIQDTLTYIHLRMGMKQQALTSLDRLLARATGEARRPLEGLRAQVSRGETEAARRRMEEDRDRLRAVGGTS